MDLQQVREMPASDFESWREFYRLFPFDDRHRYHRPAARVAAAMSGQYDQHIEFLAPEPRPAGYSSADLGVMKALGLRPKPKKG